MEFVHKSVLLNEVIEGLDIKENGTYVDGTLAERGMPCMYVKSLEKMQVYRNRPGRRCHRSQHKTIRKIW